MRYSLPTLYVCLLLAGAGAQRFKSGVRKSREITEDEVCREKPHYVCRDNECVPVANARCDRIIQCEDGSDEEDCPGESGCVLPQYPTGGIFEIAECTENSCSDVPGSRVPSGSSLRYRCNEGYTRKGHSALSFCHINAWQRPPSCVKICPVLMSDSVNIMYRHNGKRVHSPRKIVPGTKAILNCKDSYKIPEGNHPGYQDITCLEDGTWNRPVFNCIPECGIGASRGNPTIVNGFRAEYGDFPWHVGIYEKDRSGNFEQICGGTLVSPNLVISAAHCFYNDRYGELESASEYMLVAGKFYRHYNLPDHYSQNSTVRRIEIDEKFLGIIANYANDIALLHLTTRLTMTPFVRPICIDWDNKFESEQLRNGKFGKVVGWGLNAEGDYSTELHTINLPYVDDLTCLNKVPEDFKGYVTSDKFCAGYLNGSGVCNGDSGGGLCFKHNELWYLRGIVSSGPRVANAYCDHYSTFTNVGTFLRWISSAIFGSSNLPGEETLASDDAVTAAPIDHRMTTEFGTSIGCVLPEQPTHGRYELRPCKRPCNVRPGIRVPNSSFLTYRCNEGYVPHGNNAVTVCINNAWYLPTTCLTKVTGNHCPALKSKSKNVVCKYRNEIVPCEFEMPSGTKASLACKSQNVIPSLEDPEYTSEIICLDNGTWDHPVIECSYECGTRVPEGTQLVVNGSESERGKFSWRALLYKKDSHGRFSWVTGFETLISPGLVITTSRYLHGDLTPSNWEVAAGFCGDEHAYDAPGAYTQKSLVQSIYRAKEHHVLKENQPEPSIVLLRLETPFTMTALVRPICIDWGNTVATEAIQNRATDETGRTINHPYVPYEECLSRLKEGAKQYLVTDMFCTNWETTGLQAGNTADYGYVFAYLFHGIWYLLGVHSNNLGTISSNVMDTFMKIGPHLNWISAAYNVSGCLLPEQPTHGTFELSPCGSPCHVVPGTRVQNGSILTYRCNEGYVTNGDNTFTVCMTDVWSLPLACLRKVPGKYCPGLRSKSKNVVCKYRNEIVPCEFEMPSGTKATLACKSQNVIPSLEDPEYTSEIICLDNGTWDHPVIECSYECGTRVPEGTQFVVNGSASERGKFSWRALLYKKDSNGRFLWVKGFETLISPDLVITTSRYLQGNSDPSYWEVAAGFCGDEHAYDTPGAYSQKSLVEQIYRAEARYVLGERNPQPSIVLLRLKTPFTITALVRPICIDWKNRVETVAIQNGQTDETGRTINHPYIPYNECLPRIKEGAKRYLATDMFCTNWESTGSQAGNTADYGYVFAYSSQGIWYLLGVHSNNLNRVSSNLMDTFMKIGPHLDWIRATYNVSIG